MTQDGEFAHTPKKEGYEMNDTYAVFPKVVPVGQNAEIVISGLQARTLNPGETYNVQVRSMTNHSDEKLFKALAFPPINAPTFCDPSHGGVFKFNHTFTSQGEYSVIVTRDDEPATRVTTEHIYAADPELAQLRPYKGDLHIHTYYSDGRLSPIQMAVLGRKLGLDFAAITDHGRYEPSLEAIRHAREINLDLLLFPGEEISFPAGHILRKGWQNRTCRRQRRR